MLISAVVTNYNGVELLRQNLPRLLGLLDRSKLEYEVVVVDDASTDDSQKYLESLRPRDGHLRTIFKEKNEGFPSTVALGFRKARGEVIFSIKSDTVPKNPEYFKLLLEHFKDPPAFAKASAGKKVFAVSAALSERVGGKEDVRGRGEIYFEKGFFLHRRGSNEGGISAWADGSASAFRKDLYRKVGGFDSLYDPFYWEDVDLGYRAWKAGYEIDFEPKAILLHEYESGAIAKHYTKDQVRTISQRNQFIFVWKNADIKHLVLYFLWELYHAAVALKNGDWWFFGAYYQAMHRWPKILLARWRQKGISRLSDEVVLAKFSCPAKEEV